MVEDAGRGEEQGKPDEGLSLDRGGTHDHGLTDKTTKERER
jgi:hypothetical protein